MYPSSSLKENIESISFEFGNWNPGHSFRKICMKQTWPTGATLINEFCYISKECIPTRFTLITYQFIWYWFFSLIFLYYFVTFSRKLQQWMDSTFKFLDILRHFIFSICIWIQFTAPWYFLLSILTSLNILLTFNSVAHAIVIQLVMCLKTLLAIDFWFGASAIPCIIVFCYFK